MTRLYKGYDKASLDAQFVLSGADDLDALFARRQRAAEAARSRHRSARGLAYGGRPGETLDVYMPERADGAPVLLFIHGGFWRSLAAADFAFVADGFVPAGIVTVVIDYPLIPQTDLAGIIMSCTRALAWVRENIANHGGDPDNVHISGNSAGGHLVAEIAHPNRVRASGLPPETIRSVCAISGLFELAPVRLSFQNETLDLMQADVELFSPQRRVTPGFPPTLVTVGGLETQEFLDQSSDYADGLRAHGNQADLLVAPAANHITIVLDHFARPGSDLNTAALTLMGSVRA
ncbi:MAG: alpha/beta hydrolase [Pseudomonadota bacterium]